MARQVLENGVILPAEYSDDWYDDMTSNLTKLDDVIGSDSEKLSSADVGAAALSNNYNDLDNLPTIPTVIPTVNDATLTIQKNGVDVQTFTANASSNVTANITVPTKTSELTNNSGFLTSHQSLMYINGDRANNAYRIECGKFHNSNNVSTGRHRFTFPHSFSSTPTVAATLQNADGTYFLQVSDITNTSFIAEIWDGSGDRTINGVAVYYIAIGKS